MIGGQHSLLKLSNPPVFQNSPKLQIQTQPAFQQPTYQPKPQFNGPVLTSSPVGGQPSRVKAASPKQSDEGAAALPFTQCPSAMKCVEKRVCDFNGVMRDFVTTLSPAQESLRVPLIPCVSQRASGEVDVCCRDPNYKDPWPEQEQAREGSRALGGDEWRWSKDVRSRENAARSRSKVAANNLPTQLAANQATPQVAQLPSRVAANQPTSIFEENVQEFSSTPKTEEVRKPKRRIAYG